MPVFSILYRPSPKTVIYHSVDLPFFLEASDDYSSAILKDIAESIGSKVHFIDTDHRRLLHVAAVFACNFTNHMLTAGKQITEKAGFSFEVLKPLINETVMKALEDRS